MSKKENISVAPCGLSCGHCRLYLAKDDPAMMEWLISRGFNRDSFPCPGCRAAEGKVACSKESFEFARVDGRCATYACSVEHGVDFCCDCHEFPCEKLQPCANLAGELPHNMKVFYLSYIKHHGVDEFLRKYPEFGPRYYFGKMVIGKGPQLSAEEWQSIRDRLSASAKPEKS